MADPVSKAAIVTAAFAVLDETGIDGLTVRAVATRLGVKAPALYWHLRSKQELLDEMGTEILRRIGAALDDVPADAPFADALRTYGRATRAEYRRHRDGARTFSGTRITDVGLLRRQDAELSRRLARGASLQAVLDAVEIVTSFVVGFVIEEQERAQSAPERYDLDRRDAALGAGYPLAAEAGRLLFADPDERFERQLQVVVHGVTAGAPGGPGRTAADVDPPPGASESAVNLDG